MAQIHGPLKTLFSYSPLGALWHDNCVLYLKETGLRAFVRTISTHLISNR